MRRQPEDAPVDAAAEAPLRDAAIHVIVNRASGGQDADRLAQIRAGFAAAGAAERTRIEAVPGREMSARARAAAEAGAGVVVACGGDGTICAVAEGLAQARAGGESGAALGVLPAGTFNYFARGLGLPERIAPAARIIAEGHTRPLATGAVNGRLFLNNASIGVYPAILREREQIYARFGRSRLAAYWSVLRVLRGFGGPLRLHIEADGREIRTRSPLAFVAGSAYQLDLLGVDGAEAIRGGRLALLLAPDDHPGGLVRRALRLGARRAERGEDYTLVAARSIRIHAGPGARLVARDGERARMRGPFEFTLSAHALRAVVPAEGWAETPDAAAEAAA
ncbi:diacylglycerol/lipid kinase family protein [Rhodovulum sp. DZ06]|uniref:diacylglycerol/lipid kinase family protein n=1 Tax=Rhodovulum sp. DZ06 TaxID=3425126 RepID=UPI003D34C366